MSHHAGYTCRKCGEPLKRSVVDGAYYCACGHDPYSKVRQQDEDDCEDEGGLDQDRG